MEQLFHRYKTLIITLSILSAIILYVIYKLLDVPPRLTIYRPEMIDLKLVDSSLHYSKQHHKVQDFSLINQNGDTITQEFYNDKIYVADFFFTTCTTICPVMTDHMVQIQEKLQQDQDVLLLSHSVIPEYDTPEILNAYGVKKGVDPNKWNLVTGPRKEIYALARKGYLAVEIVPGEEDAMVHTENFMLVDKKKRIRGYYDGTNPKDIDQLLEDIEILKAEYAPPKTFWQKLF